MTGPNTGSTLRMDTSELLSHLRNAASLAIQKGASAVSVKKSTVITLMNLHRAEADSR